MSIVIVYVIVQMKELKPIVKYAGGKRQIMDKITSYFPKEFKDYYEPFLGGGSVLFHLENKKVLSNTIYISDVMDSLVNMYNIIKSNSKQLIEELSHDTIYKNTKTSFIENRKRFNELKIKQVRSITEDVEYAALFIYLNKTCFNGMYRENKKGEYNVPFGKQKNPVICNDELINCVSDFLRKQNVNIKCGDYTYIESHVKKDDFVYMDPPYYNTFTGYNKTKFDKESQIKLRDLFVILTNRGCKVALSNSNHVFIRELYSNIKDIKLIEIPVKRVINSKKEERNKQITELLIINYKQNYKNDNKDNQDFRTKN